MPILLIISIFGLLLSVALGVFVAIKLNTFNLISLLIITTFLLQSNEFSSKMSKKELTLKKRFEFIEESLKEIKRGMFYGGKKKKEIRNFAIGIILGIGIALIIEAGLEFTSSTSQMVALTSAYEEEGINITSLVGIEAVNYDYTKSYLISSFITLAIAIMIGMAIVIWTFQFYLYSNLDLKEHSIIYSYELHSKKGDIDSLSKKLIPYFMLRLDTKGRLNPKRIINHKKGIHRIVFRRKFFWLFEGSNLIIISNEEIKIRGRTNIFGERFCIKAEDIMETLLKESYFKKLVLIDRS